MPAPQTEVELLHLVASDPERYLGEPSIHRFQAFAIGFQQALPKGALYGWVDRRDLENFFLAQSPRSRQWPQHADVVSYLHFLGAKPADAFASFVDLLTRYDGVIQPQPRTYGPANVAMLLEDACTHPSHYLSNHDHMGGLVAMLNGYVCGETCLDGISAVRSLLEQFQSWMEARRPWSQGRPWHAMLLLENLWSESRAVTAFGTYFRMFVAGEDPDATTPAARHLFETNPELASMTEEQRQQWKRQLNRVFY